MKIIKSFIILLALLLDPACSSSQATSRLPQDRSDAGQATFTSPRRVREYTYEVVKSYPHDTNAFTQGLVYEDGVFYESTGLNGKSSIRKVDIETGQIIRKVDVDSQYFGEGLAVLNGRAFQLTWLSQRGFIYDLNSFQLLDTFSYTGEGWGLTHDNRSLIMSDGSNRIRFLDPATFEVRRIISVYNDNVPLNSLNELEYIKGEIYANIWNTDRIVIIEPYGGRITGWVDLRGLLKNEDRTGPVDVLNGIAYDHKTDRIFVTGKLWPKVYQIRLKTPRNQVSR